MNKAYRLMEAQFKLMQFAFIYPSHPAARRALDKAFWINGWVTSALKVGAYGPQVHA